MDDSVYEVIVISEDSQCIQRTDVDGKVYIIPTDPANSDYQAYLASLETE